MIILTAWYQYSQRAGSAGPKRQRPTLLQGRRLVTILEEHFVPQTRTGGPLDPPSSVFQMGGACIGMVWTVCLLRLTNVWTDYLEIRQGVPLNVFHKIKTPAPGFMQHQPEHLFQLWLSLSLQTVSWPLLYSLDINSGSGRGERSSDIFSRPMREWVHVPLAIAASQFWSCIHFPGFISHFPRLHFIIPIS